MDVEKGDGLVVPEVQSLEVFFEVDAIYFGVLLVQALQKVLL